MKLILYAVISVAAAALALLLAGQLGLLKGKAPADLGVREGKLKPPARTPNSVSSQAQLHAGTDALVDYAQIAPLALNGDGAQAMQRLRSAIGSMPGAQIVEARPDYIYAQFTTRWLKFVDDAEFWLSPADKTIHVRSASRIGRADFGANRARVEAIRVQLAAASAGTSAETSAR